MEIGIALSSEDHGPVELVRQARLAEEHGFDRVWVSDHYHPWVPAQGHSPFVWSVLGGIASTTSLRMGTGVTCPTLRIHPAIIAQAAATTAVMAEGKFWLGVGSGEALNEHILGTKWPEADVRLAMLEEAVEVLRLLWQGGSQSHRGRHYTVENAEIYDLPSSAIPVYVSAFGDKAAEVAARIGDGYVGTSPDPELVSAYASAGGKGPKIAGTKVAFASDAEEGKRLVYEKWPNMGLPGELAQILPTPAHFEQACELVDESIGDSVPTGPDAKAYVESIREFADAGYNELYIHNIGPHHEAFFTFFNDEVRPAL